MQTTFQASCKTIGEALPGELICGMLHENVSLSVVLDRRSEDGDYVLLGVLNSPEFEHPVLKYGNSEDNCVSFGLDWCVDPDHSKIGYDYGEHLVRYGALTPTKTGWMLKFQSDRESGEWWCLNNGKKGAVSRRLVSFGGWSVWRSAADWTNSRVRPLLEY